MGITSQAYFFGLSNNILLSFGKRGAIMNFRKTAKMRAIERKFGEPVEAVLRQYYIEKGYTLSDLAELLDISESTVWLWMLKLGIPTRQWRLPEEAEAKGGEA